MAIFGLQGASWANFGFHFSQSGHFSAEFLYIWGSFSARFLIYLQFSTSPRPIYDDNDDDDDDDDNNDDDDDDGDNGDDDDDDDKN